MAFIEQEVLRGCFLSLKSLHNRLSEIRHTRYPSGSISPFIYLFELAFDRLWSQLLIHDQNLQRGYAGNIRPHLQYVWNFINLDCPEYLCLLETANSTKVPHEIIRPLEDIAGNILGNTKLLFRASDALNFSTINVLELVDIEINRTVQALYATIGVLDFISDLNRFLKEKNEGPYDSLCIISFPSLDRGTFLQHTIIGHEIGHIIVRKKAKDIFENEQIAESVRKQFSEKLGFPSAVNKGEKIIDELMEIFWIYFEELYCDFVEYEMFGWSAIFSEFAFNIGRPEPDTWWQNHPPDRYRLMELLKHAKPMDFLLALKKLPSELEKSIGQRCDEILKWVGYTKGIGVKIDEIQDRKMDLEGIPLNQKIVLVSCV
jgi:hypothetical protein